MESVSVAVRNCKLYKKIFSIAFKPSGQTRGGVVKCASNYHICYGSSEFVHHFTIIPHITTSHLTNQRRLST